MLFGAEHGADVHDREDQGEDERALLVEEHDRALGLARSPPAEPRVHARDVRDDREQDRDAEQLDRAVVRRLGRHARAEAVHEERQAEAE